MSRQDEIAREQAVITRLYARLDELRDTTRGRLRDIRRRGATGSPQNRSERDAFAAMYEDRLTALDAVEAGLCFGRLDRTGGERFHIGRIGLSDERHESMLVDWRAPAAEPFYRATPAEPMGVTRRRQLRTRGRAVLDVEDDVFDMEGLSDADRETLGGGGALLAAVSAARTGRMRDIVATIQAEQDRVIRDDPAGVLVVQGGPGTGKTAVALHRAAYLLYNDRERLARTGVLVVGPGATFLRYIEQVLPALGETGVLTSTLPGLLATSPARADQLRSDAAAVAKVKADLRMAELLARAVADLQRPPDEPVTVPFDELELVLTATDVARAQARARRSRHRHNRARYAFARHLLRLLVGRLAEIDPELAARQWAVRTLMGADEFRELADRFWPRVSATDLVASLLSDADRLERVGADLLSPSERRGLVRSPDAAWTDSDVPLIDEAWALLGDPDEMLRVAADRRRLRADREFAQRVLEDTGTAGRIDPGTLAERFADPGPQHATVAERAALDPGWEFGHVIVDEAQELSPMAWRMIARRCPSRSMTVVGDLAQAASPWAPADWADVFDATAPGRWRLRELTVNYRTPAEVMQLAGAVLAAIDPALQPPSSVRASGEVPAAVRIGSAYEIAEHVAGIAERAGQGRVAVIVPDGLADDVTAALLDRLPGRAGAGAEGLDAPVAVLRVGEAKGLEFDEVAVVEPGRWTASGDRGMRDLYVALTRATQRVTLLHRDPLPEVVAAGLAGIRPGEVDDERLAEQGAGLPRTGTAG